MASTPSLPDSGYSPDQRNLVVFRLVEQSYALPIEPIVQIIPMVTITPIPQVSDMVEGLINVRGEAIPVVNLRHHLGLPQVALQLYTPILLVKISEWTVGLIVDEVLDVLSVPGGQIAHPTDLLPEELGQAPVLQGLAYREGGMVLVLDLNHLFLPEQVRALAQAAEELPTVVIELALEELPAEAEAKPTSKKRKKAPAKKAAKEKAAEVEAKPTGKKRKKAPAKKATKEKAAEVEAKPTGKKRKKAPAKKATKEKAAKAEAKPTRKRTGAKKASEQEPTQAQPKPVRGRRKKTPGKKTSGEPSARTGPKASRKGGRKKPTTEW